MHSESVVAFYPQM